jgi:hypothetical protein
VRIAVVIVSLAAIGVGLVSIRRMEMSVRHETMELLKMRNIALPRKYCSQDIDLGCLGSPAEVARRAVEMALEMTGRDRTQYCQTNSEVGNRKQ